jgi:hypothetical protein
MALTASNIKNMMSGFSQAGYVCIERPASTTNPIKLQWTDRDGQVLTFRIWAFDVTHGGGGSEVRAADEYRIQITAAPDNAKGLDYDNATDILVGFSPSANVIVGYDREWLKRRSQKGTGSPSVQVKTHHIEAAKVEGMHHLTKKADFGMAGIVTLTPQYFPTYLKDHSTYLASGVEKVPMLATETKEPESLWHYCMERGFYFDPDILARYVASISTKPFAILAGVSGTGKSKIAELVAEYYSRQSGEALVEEDVAGSTTGSKFAFVPSTATTKHTRSRFALVPVRPDWIDNQSILGFVNPLTGRYESTQALDLILRANAALSLAEDPLNAPRYFMLLDEMNLARVEHYFSDWLACTESRRYLPDNSIQQQPVPLHRHESAKMTLVDESGRDVELDVPQTLELPTNLIVTGTVNVDETTFTFSPKVLDRSMVIEFNDVDLELLRNGHVDKSEKGYRFPKKLPAFLLPTTNAFVKLPDATHDHLVAINKILADAQLHFGYRAVAEISLFIYHYDQILPTNADDTNLIRALDGAILQKILPRIQGNRARIENTLCYLLYYLRELTPAPSEKHLESLRPNDDAKMVRSYRRAFNMLESLREFGFTSFFK